VTNQIIIVGFMGTGKTTVARELAQRLGCPAVDLDDLITNNEWRSPKEIIEQDGENRFREIETRMLREALLEKTARIVAVGGGAWTIAQNRKLIADKGAFTVWLDAPFELCWKRIEAGGEARPLARSRELAQKLYRERRGIYELAEARITVAESDNVEEIATRVIREIRERTRAPRSDIS
jgi:shikimate kinase